jgi:hypothetical protein
LAFASEFGAKGLREVRNRVSPRAVNFKLKGICAMEWLVWIGTGLTLIGLSLLAYCIFAAIAAKRAGRPEAELRVKLQRIVVINMGALLLSALGLMSVVIGIFLT